MSQEVKETTKFAPKAKKPCNLVARKARHGYENEKHALQSVLSGLVAPLGLARHFRHETVVGLALDKKRVAPVLDVVPREKIRIRLVFAVLLARETFLVVVKNARFGRRHAARLTHDARLLARLAFVDARGDALLRHGLRALGAAPRAIGDNIDAFLFSIRPGRNRLVAHGAHFVGPVGVLAGKSQRTRAAFDRRRAAINAGANVLVARHGVLAVNGVLRQLHAPGAISFDGIGRTFFPCAHSFAGKTNAIGSVGIAAHQAFGAAVAHASIVAAVLAEE